MSVSSCCRNISGILSHKIPKYTITNAIYFEWRSTLVWLRNVFKQYFEDCLISFEQLFSKIFSKAENTDGKFRWSSYHDCTSRWNIEMEAKYLPKSDVYLNPNSLRTKNDKTVLQKALE